jgi:engulfment/cell motility protein 1
MAIHASRAYSSPFPPFPRRAIPVPTDAKKKTGWLARGPQDNSLKHVHYVDSQAKFPVRSGLEDLPDRFDLALITEIATANCAPPPAEGTGGPGAPPLVASPLSFSLITPEGSLTDAIAPDVSRWADWTDGLNMLRRDSGHVASKETADFIQALTEIGLKIKLLGALQLWHLPPHLLASRLLPHGLTYIFLSTLDLSGDNVEIPSGLAAGPPPVNTDFFFSDLYEPQ